MDVHLSSSYDYLYGAWVESACAVISGYGCCASAAFGFED
jgi:hypothetical protein